MEKTGIFSDLLSTSACATDLFIIQGLSEGMLSPEGHSSLCSISSIFLYPSVSCLSLKNKTKSWILMEHILGL